MQLRKYSTLNNRQIFIGSNNYFHWVNIIGNTTLKVKVKYLN